jgi:hypothetical protein
MGSRDAQSITVANILPTNPIRSKSAIIEPTPF